jgi:hypothetical protein
MSYFLPIPSQESGEKLSIALWTWSKNANSSDTSMFTTIHQDSDNKYYLCFEEIDLIVLFDGFMDYLTTSILKDVFSDIIKAGYMSNNDINIMLTKVNNPIFVYNFLPDSWKSLAITELN